MQRIADLLRKAAINGRGGALACTLCRARCCLRCRLCHTPASLLRSSLLRCAQPLAAWEDLLIPLHEVQTAIQWLRKALQVVACWKRFALLPYYQMKSEVTSSPPNYLLIWQIMMIN